MNKQGPNGIGWCDYTWNPVTGCKHGCPYCYAKAAYDRFGLSFEPRYHPERLAEPLHRKEPSRIFVSSTGDILGRWVPELWIRKVLEIVIQAPQHTFQFLTKNPTRYREFLWPGNAWIGATATEPEEAEWAVSQLLPVDARVRFLSLEPLISWRDGEHPFIDGIQWAIIGPPTGPDWRDICAAPCEFTACVETCDFFRIPIYMKSAVPKAWQPGCWEGGLRREFPNGSTDTINDQGMNI
jgi:protein gp37